MEFIYYQKKVLAFYHNFIFFCHCLHRWERHSWECWQRHESIWHRTTVSEWVSECSLLGIRSSFKRFLHCGSKVLGVVHSSKCFVLKWETGCRVSTCVVGSFLYLDTDLALSTSSFASLNVTFFADVPVSGVIRYRKVLRTETVSERPV